MPLRHLTRSIEFKQMIGDVLHRLLCLCTGACPVRRPHAVQARRSSLRPDVFLQESDLIRRHKELVVPTVQNPQIVAVNTRDLERLHAEVFPDAMRGMDDVVAGCNLAKVANALPRRCRTAQLCLVPSEDILLREHGDPRRTQLKARAQTARSNGDSTVLGIALPAHEDGGELPSHQHVADEICPLHPAREYEHLHSIRQIAAQLTLKKVELPSECRHGHHLKCDEIGGGARGKGAAHQRGKYLVARHACRNDLLPREQTCRPLLILLHRIRKRSDET